MRGGAACVPRVPARGPRPRRLVDPALAWLRARGARVRLGRRVAALEHRRTAASPNSDVGRADPGRRRARRWCSPSRRRSPPACCPGYACPDAFEAILNVHFRVDADGGPSRVHRADRRHGRVGVRQARRASPSPSAPPTAWWTSRPRASPPPCGPMCAPTLAPVRPDAALARGEGEARHVRRHRPRRSGRRPRRAPALVNLVLAGDWTATGLPATIEGAIRSGRTAAELLLRGLTPDLLHMPLRNRLSRSLPDDRRSRTSTHAIARAGDGAARGGSAPTGIGCSSWRRTRPSRPNTCCSSTILDRIDPELEAQDRRLSARASRARMAAGRCSTTARSISRPA